MAKGGCMWEGPRNQTTDLVAYLGGPDLGHIGMQNMLAQGPKVLVAMIEVIWGN